jgi:hypothetical protein
VLETINVDIADDLRIGRDLQKALRTSMTTLGWYLQLKEQAHAKMKQAKYRSHRTFESQYDVLRTLHPKMTETQIKNKVHLTRKWRKRIERYMVWRDRYRMLDVLCHALYERNQNLRTLESSERKERLGAY